MKQTLHFRFHQHTCQGYPFSVHVDAKNNVNHTFYNTSFAADMIVACIHKDTGIHFFQRTFPPFFYNWQDFVCDPANCAVRNIHIISRICDSMFPVVILLAYMESIFLPCPTLLYSDIFDQLRFLVTVTIPWNSPIHVSITGVHGFVRMFFLLLSVSLFQ